MTTITLPRQDYISVRYFDGAGGKFLTSWLTAAKNESDQYLSLTNVGSADPSVLEIQQSVPHNFRSEQHKQFLSTVVPGVAGTAPPYFVLDQSQSLDDSLECVQRVINISYDINDVDDIAWCNYKKSFMQQQNVNLLDAESILEQITETVGGCWIKFRAKTDTERVCYVKWKDLLSGDPVVLVEKLAGFTGISVSKFDLALLGQWRTGTRTLLDSRGTA
jgi:hypothetical protein